MRATARGPQVPTIRLILTFLHNLNKDETEGIVEVWYKSVKQDYWYPHCFSPRTRITFRILPDRSLESPCRATAQHVSNMAGAPKTEASIFLYVL